MTFDTEHNFKDVYKLLDFILNECGDMPNWGLTDYIHRDTGNRGKQLIIKEEHINNERLLYALELAKKFFNENIIALELVFLKELEQLVLSNTQLEKISFYLSDMDDNFKMPKLPMSVTFVHNNDIYFYIKDGSDTDTDYHNKKNGEFYKYKLDIIYTYTTEDKEYFSNNKEELIKIIEDYNDF